MDCGALEPAWLVPGLIRTRIRLQGTARARLIRPRDKGTATPPQPIAAVWAELGVTHHLARRHIANDKPGAETRFKAFKYRWDFRDQLPKVALFRSPRRSRSRHRFIQGTRTRNPFGDVSCQSAAGGSTPAVGPW